MSTPGAPGRRRRRARRAKVAGGPAAVGRRCDPSGRSGRLNSDRATTTLRGRDRAPHARTRAEPPAGRGAHAQFCWGLPRTSSGGIARAGGGQSRFKQELEIATQLADEHLMAIAEGNVAEVGAAHRGGCRHGGGSSGGVSRTSPSLLGRPASVAHSLIVAARLDGQLGSGAPRVALNAKSRASACRRQVSTCTTTICVRIQEMLHLAEQRLGDGEFHPPACERGPRADAAGLRRSLRRVALAEVCRDEFESGSGSGG